MYSISKSSSLLVFIILSTLAYEMANADPVPLIFETDMTFDVDDVGALAVVHALADRGEVELLMVSYNEVHPSGVAAIQSINAWYGREQVPIGAFNEHLSDPDDSKYLKALADSGLTPNNKRQDSVQLYVDVLSEAPDHSVTIVSVGFLNNLRNLLINHQDLIKRKVLKLVLMGGLKNDNFNFVRHALVKETEYVMTHWPTLIAVVDFGVEVKTGSALNETPLDNPIRLAYSQWFGGKPGDRPSWDQVAVLYGVRGTSRHFEEVTRGEGILRNGYRWQLEPETRIYVQPRQSAEQLKQTIESLMIAQAANQQ